jgi:hypothetical protein
MTESQYTHARMPQKEALPLTLIGVASLPTKPSRSRQFKGNFASAGGTSNSLQALNRKKFSRPEGARSRTCPSPSMKRREIQPENQERFGLAELRLFLPSCCG